jgi:hypothetical protein
VEKAQQVAQVFSEFERIVHPDPRQISSDVYSRRRRSPTARHLELAQKRDFLFYGLYPHRSSVAMTELHCWENAMEFDLLALRTFVERLLEG